ncbi:unnamed protein product [Bursaphelenchus xylophilus]|uniref:(pine wood nematode) hypothetical protein n=1 Tax=Bursaphelenchus xylophilus TaxID=6326 RepID=A0A1I7RWX3_BURXY|nr:unnamed protein product [Bursaphelenchus xylophilus]CAG9121177.1 unnamed protein product [Bursaphelenchus xylophilus]
MLRFGSFRLNQQIVVRYVNSSAAFVTSNPGLNAAAAPRFPRRTALHRPSPAVQAALNHQRALIEKHKDAVEVLDESNIFNLTDGLEFSSSVSFPALRAVKKLISKSPEKINALSDQRLAVLVSAAGQKSELNVEKSLRAGYLKEIWPKILAAENFGLEALNAYLETSVLLDETFSLTSVLDILAEKNLTANSKTYENLVAGANAQGNIQAIVEIIKEMKANNIPLSQTAVEKWVECLGLKDARKDFKAVIQAFKSSLDPFRLYVSASIGLARAGKGAECTEILVDLPSAETRASPKNVDLVIKLFNLLVKNKVAKAAEIVRPYLPEGRLDFTQQAHLRVALIQALKNKVPAENTAQIIELVREDKAVRYSLINHSYRYFLETYEHALAHGLDAEKIVKQLVKWTSVLKANDLSQNPLADVVQQAILEKVPVKELYKTFIHSQEAQDLMAEEGQRAHIFIPLVNQVVKQLPESKIADSTFKELIFLCNSTRGGSFSTLATALAQKSVPYIKSVLNSIENNSFLVTEIVGVMLSNEQLDRLSELMTTKLETEKDVRIMINRVINPIMRNLKSNKFNEEDLPAISKVIANGFNASDKSAQTPGGEAIAAILAASTIADARVEKLIKLLVDEPKVTIGSAEIKRIEAKLLEVNLPHRAGLIKYLKRKSTTYQRWQTTEDIGELEREAESLEKAEDVPAGVLLTLYEVILKKAVAEKNVPAIMNTLPKFYKKEKDQSDVKIFKGRIVEAHNMALLENMNNEAWEAADLLWNLKPLKNVETVLLYALTLCRRGMTEEAHEVLKNFKSAALNLQPSYFNNVASSSVLKAAGEPEIEQFLKLLSKEFNIKSTWKARLKAEVKMNKLRALMEQKKLDEAFTVCMETSKECGYAFGAFELMNEALQAENQVLVKKLKTLIISVEDINTFIITFGVCLLERGDKRGVDLLKSKIEYIPSKKLTELTQREFNLKNPEIMHLLFNIFNKPENSVLELEDLMRKTAELYERQNNLDGLKRLFDDAKSSSIPLNAKIRVQFESSIKKLESASKSTETHRESAEAK